MKLVVSKNNPPKTASKNLVKYNYFRVGGKDFKILKGIIEPNFLCKPNNKNSKLKLCSKQIPFRWSLIQLHRKQLHIHLSVRRVMTPFFRLSNFLQTIVPWLIFFKYVRLKPGKFLKFFETPNLFIISRFKFFLHRVQLC